LFSTGQIKTLARAALVEDVILARRNGPVRKRGADLANETLQVGRRFEPFRKPHSHYPSASLGTRVAGPLMKLAIAGCRPRR